MPLRNLTENTVFKLSPKIGNDTTLKVMTVMIERGISPIVQWVMITLNSSQEQRMKISVYISTPLTTNA